MYAHTATFQHTTGKLAIVAKLRTAVVFKKKMTETEKKQNCGNDSLRNMCTFSVFCAPPGGVNFEILKKFFFEK